MDINVILNAALTAYEATRRDNAELGARIKALENTIKNLKDELEALENEEREEEEDLPNESS